jgi:NTP pyrophosphatase (non-canonical NTP hydrolase)
MSQLREHYLQAIRDERTRQDRKWGFPQHRSTAEWMTILAEEVGEVAMEANEVHFRARDRSELVTELVQVAAVCVSWLEHMSEGEVE